MDSSYFDVSVSGTRAYIPRREWGVEVLSILDLDDDGEGDACDIEDGAIFQFRGASGPMEWQPEIGPTEWSVYVGDLEVLRASFAYTQEPGSRQRGT